MGGGLTGGASGAAGAAAGAAAAPVIAEQVANLDLSEPVRKAVIAVADTAVGAVAGALAGGGAAGAVTAGNQVVNNYLKHEELQAKRKELAECKTDACRQGVEKKWSEVSQKRDEAMETVCRLGSAEQCRGVIAEAQTDIAALKANGTPGGVLGLVPDERNNIKQAELLVKGGLQVLQQTANLALDSTYAGSDEIAKSGLMTEREIEALKQKNTDQLIDVATAVIPIGGSKAPGSKSTVGASTEAPAAAGQARSGSTEAPGMLRQNPVTGVYEPVGGSSVVVLAEAPLLTGLVKAEGAVPLGGARIGSVAPLPVGAVDMASPQTPAAGSTASGAVAEQPAAGGAAANAGNVPAPTVAGNVDNLLPNTATQVLTETQARRLGGENKGLIYVTETPRGSEAAKDLQAGTTGAFSDLATQKPAVPALRFDNPNEKGANYVKFDGIEKAPDGSTVLLIDAKTKMATFNDGAVRDTVASLERVKGALDQNPGFKVVYEFPNQDAADAAKQFLLNNGMDNVIRVRVRGGK